MIVSGCASAIARNGVPTSPSRQSARTDSDSIRVPDCSRGATISIIACMIEGTPAMVMTLPILKPGARMVALWISSAPSGMRAMRNRASFNSPGFLNRSLKRATTSG